MDTSRQFHVGRPNIGDRAVFLERVGEILESRWLSNGGKYCEAFEAALRETLGVEHCVAVCNATIGLEIAARATGMRGEVIVPSFTFVATAHALQWQGITPVFGEVDPATHNLDPAEIDRLVTDRTTGILAVHCWGRGAAVAELEAAAERHGLRLVFDASHALGCTHGGRRIGGFGDAEVFSFHATKFVNSFEGGVVTTNDAGLAEKIRLMRNFGFRDYDCVDSVGTNGKMSEVSAAMGLTNLESVDEFVAVNRRNYEAYRAGLEGIPGISLVRYDEAESWNYQYVVAEVDPGTAATSRDELVEFLHGRGVVARRYFHPGCHRMEPYRSLNPVALPVTEALADRVLVLPTGTAVDEEEVGTICGFVREGLG